MPFYDQKCQTCDWTAEVLLRVDEQMACPNCGAATEHYWKPGHTSGVVTDEIPGGLVLTNIGEPVTVYSHSERLRVAKERGYSPAYQCAEVNGMDVRAPGQAVWHSVPLMGEAEEERIRHWHEHEKMITK